VFVALVVLMCFFIKSLQSLVLNLTLHDVVKPGQSMHVIEAHLLVACDIYINSSTDAASSSLQ
jgi:hypothetical protein